MCDAHRIEWAVLSDDGHVYEVVAKAEGAAHREAGGLRIPGEGGYVEPTARVVERRICSWAGDYLHEPAPDRATPIT